MKKLLKAVVAVGMCMSLCACGASVSTEKSETGQLHTTIKGSTVKLNHIEYEFPEGYTFEDGKFTEPIGISYAQVENEAGEIVGVCADGMYSEEITRDNVIDVVNTVYMTVHSVENPLELNSDMFIEGDDLTMLVIGLDDGTAVFLGQFGTPNFVYMTETNSDSDSVMQDYLEQAVLQLGGEEEHTLFFGE